jgi:hypothetical protein
MQFYEEILITLTCHLALNVCVLGSNLMWWQHILLSNSWSSHCSSCDRPLLPCFRAAFAEERFTTNMLWKWNVSKNWKRKMCCKVTLECIVFFKKETTRAPFGYPWLTMCVVKMHIFDFRRRGKPLSYNLVEIIPDENDSIPVCSEKKKATRRQKDVSDTFSLHGFFIIKRLR